MTSMPEVVGKSEPRVLLTSKKKTKRPCDACRRKKVRCNRDEISGDRCSSCITYRLECTYLEMPKKRSSAEDYVRDLERRLEQMKKLLQTICPDTDFSVKLNGITETDELVTMGKPYLQSAPVNVGDYTTDGDDELQSSDDEFTTFNPSNPHRYLPISHGTTTSFGKSSGPILIQTAVEMKKEFHNPHGQGASSIGEDVHPEECFPSRRRPEFWHFEPWGNLELDEPKPDYTFPDSDLLPSLVDNYFIRMNLILPLLHRPTFEQSLADNLHLRDAKFGGVVLLVAAVGARFSSDPRVFVPGTDPTHSVGCMWFHQVQIMLRSFYTLPSLYDLQIYCLSAMFLLGSVAPQSCWAVIGIGIRLAQAVGVHRKRVYGKTPTVGNELWKRAFWVLVALDRFCSSGLGRSGAVQDEDFDLEFPAECDDEYWTATETSQAFMQPPEKPSKMSFFVSYLKLDHILASTLRTIYSIKKPKFSSTAISGQWEQKIVAELDSALNKWHDSLPDHLRWDPHRENTGFLQQSAVLYANYYNVQICVHRPFVSSSQKASTLSFPSLAICMNAARSCSRLTDFSRERLGPILQHLTMPTFTAGVMLLFNIWGGKWAGMSINPAEEMKDVHRCMSVLGAAEKSWNPAGRLWDILHELAYIGDLPSPNRHSGHSEKRQRDSNGPPSVGSSSVYTSPPAPEEPRVIAGSCRVSCTKEVVQLQSASQENPTPSANDSQVSIDLQEFWTSSHHTAMGSEITAGSSLSTTEFREQPAVLSRVQHLMGQGDHEIAVTPAGYAPMDTDGIAASLFPIDPLVYGDIMFDFGYYSAIASGIGQHPFGSPLDNGSSDTALDQGRPGQEPQAQQQSVDFSALHSDGGSGTMSNFNGLTLWTNAPHGFEWEDWGTYTHNFSNMARQH